MRPTVSQQTPTQDPRQEPARAGAELAPRPSARTLRRRTSLPLQSLRFVAINLRMVKMIRRSHHG